MRGNLRVACVQLMAHNVEEDDVALREALEAIDTAAAKKPDLVVLPECTYPAYMLLDWSRGAARRSAERAVARVLQAFSEKAAEHRCYLAVGVVGCEADAWYNSAVLFRPDGSILGKTSKHLLWHFDDNWFVPGSEFGVWETPWGKLGMLICADGRSPEIARVLRIKGARIILDLTNWTSSGRQPSALTNPQVEYIMRTRALENQVWIVAADKVGIEQDSVVYCGSSCVINPQGQLVARASSDKPEILSAEVPLGGEGSGLQQPERGVIDGRLDPVADRRPEEYSLLAVPYAELPVSRNLTESLVPGERAILAAAVQIKKELTTPEGWMGALRRLIAILDEQKVQLVVFPETSHLVSPQSFEPVLQVALAESEKRPGMVLVLTGPETCAGKVYKSSYVLSTGQVLGKYRKVHLEEPEKAVLTAGDLGLPVFSTPVGKMGIMLGYEGLLPEVARVLALQGADLIAWPSSFTVGRHALVARTRAGENKVFLVVANSSSEGIGESLIVDPAGILLAQAFGHRTQAISAFCNLSAARVKTVVPGTDAIIHRKPEAYRVLTS